MATSYIAPFVVYLLGSQIVGAFGEALYPIAYSILAVVTLGTLLYGLRSRKLIQPTWQVGWGVLFGVVGIVAWIVLSHLHLEAYFTDYLPSLLQPPPRAGYNPFEHLGHGVAAYVFIAVRLVGIAVLVPLAEELFWRGFLMRWLIDPEWEKVEIGEFSWHSFWIIVLMFTLAHPEWFAACVYAMLTNILLYWKKDLWPCVVAHAVSNAILAVYVLQTGEWWLW